MADPGVWSDQKRAQELGREKKALDSTVAALVSITSGIRDAKELFDMARPENDDATLVGVASDLAKFESDVVSEFSALNGSALLSAPSPFASPDSLA